MKQSGNTSNHKFYKTDFKTFEEAIEYDLKNKFKHNKRTVERLANSYGITNKNFIKELTEFAIVKIARGYANEGTDRYDNYQKIVELYKNQVNLSHRTSQSMLMQQYSTPSPLSYIASLYVKGKNKNAHYFEPSAGNGLLTIALPMQNTIVNEIDDIRLQNLRKQNFEFVSNQDATNPFTQYYKKFDGVITNPPFGTLLEPVNYDGYKIKTLDHLMALRTLDTMKDDGKTAIIIGGHTNWDDKGRIQAGKNRLFFNYLYSHYYVDDVIPLDGHKIYSKQGTSFDIRLILIDGRKEKIEGFAPLKNKKHETVISDFDDLWQRVFNQTAKSETNPAKQNRIRIAKIKANAKMKLLKIQSV